MTTDTRTEAERRYDAERDGTLYLVRQPAAAAPAWNAPAALVTDYLTAVFRRFSTEKSMPTVEGIALMAETIMTLCAAEEDEPPPAAPSSAVTVEHDEGSITYRCGSNAIYFDPSYDGVQLSVFNCSAFELEEVDSGLPDLIALMADPRVRAALGRSPAMPPVSAIEVEHLYHDLDRRGDLTEEPRGPLAYVSYMMGEDGTKAEFSIRVDGSHAPYVSLPWSQEVATDTAEQAARNLLALLNDPRVQAARVRYEAGAPLKKAA
jgi:hypothetical protein